MFYKKAKIQLRLGERLSSLKKIIFHHKVIVGLASLIFFLISLVYFSLSYDRSFQVTATLPFDQNINIFEPSTITGEGCENYNHRPYAVMMAADTRTRPLSAIASADLVVEMPVLKGGITRIMAFFNCKRPPEIGSVRSARHDFITLAASFDAIFAHWGGSKMSLDLLKASSIDNIDALINPQNVFYRKYSIAPPHNGFTSYDKLDSTAQFLGYKSLTSFEGYKHKESEANFSSDGKELLINYAKPFNLRYVYDKNSNSYLRWRGGTAENDRLDGSQVRASVIAIMRTTSRQLDLEYNDVNVTGEGEAFIFQDGEVVKGFWEKDGSLQSSKLFFKNKDGSEVEFTLGSIWIEVVDISTAITWDNVTL